MARQVANVGAVKQGRNTMSRSASERGRLGVSIGGCSFSGEWAADARLLRCTRQAGQLSRPSPPKSRNTRLDSVLHTLSEREKKVIQLRFGLTDGHPRTLEEVGREFGVTRERIRQIESKTLSKLRHPSRSQKLRDYLE